MKALDRDVDRLSDNPDGRGDAEQPLWREQFPIGTRLWRGFLWFLLYLGAVMIRQRVAYAPDVDESVRTDWLTVVKVSAFFLSQVVLIDLIGWPLAVVVVFGGAAWSLGAKRWWKALLVGLVIGVVTQLVFGSWLGLSLPAGPLLNGIPIFHG